MVSPPLFPSVSKNDDTWWGSEDTKTVYLWDSMDDQDLHNTLAKFLKRRTNGQYGKQETKHGHQSYKRWTSTSSSAYTKTSKRHTGDSRLKDGGGKATFVPRSPGSLSNVGLTTTSDVPTGAQESLTETLMTPQNNVGKDAYTVDLENDENLY